MSEENIILSDSDECRDIERERDRIEKYNKKQFKEWDGRTPLYSEAYDTYFFDEDNIICYCEDEGIRPTDLRLIICEPETPHQIDDAYWEEIYPENMGFDEVASERVRKALSELNEALAQEKPWSWFPGEFRTEYKIEEK